MRRSCSMPLPANLSLFIPSPFRRPVRYASKCSCTSPTHAGRRASLPLEVTRIRTLTYWRCHARSRNFGGPRRDNSRNCPARMLVACFLTPPSSVPLLQGVPSYAP